jgi:hypothetical protein
MAELPSTMRMIGQPISSAIRAPVFVIADTREKFWEEVVGKELVYNGMSDYLYSRIAEIYKLFVEEKLSDEHKLVLIFDIDNWKPDSLEKIEKYRSICNLIIVDDDLGSLYNAMKLAVINAPSDQELLELRKSLASATAATSVGQ